MRTRARRSVIAAVLLAGVLVAPARAQVAPILQGDIETLVGQIGAAAAAALAQDNASAAASLTAAQGLLAQMVVLARDPATVQELGGLARRLATRLIALQHLADRAQAAVANPATPPSRRTRTLRVAYARVTSLATLAGKPVLVETRSRSAGFHRPGDVVTFRVLGPDGSPCTESPVVTVENQFGAAAVDLSSVHQQADGTIALTMGDEAGGARVTVTACGRSSTRLLFNYGPKTVPGLPVGFPAALPRGTYALSFSAGGVATIGETSLGTLVNVDVHAFAHALVATFQQVAAAYSSPNCDIGVHYTPFDGDAFTVTYSVTCTVDQASATETVTFTVRKI